MRYYFNENPQVTLWREKAFEIRGQFKEYKKVAEVYNQRIVDELNDLTGKIRHFNSLPWYKKMFYKFDV